VWKLLIANFYRMLGKVPVFMSRGIILKCIFKYWDGEAWAGSFWLRVGTGARCL
jgi:hypothetical protein